MKQLLILSGKGGTGKTTVASSFIYLLSAKGFADCDVDAPNLHLIQHFSVDNPSKTQDFYGLKQAHINSDLCIGCGLCYEHCAFDAIIQSYNHEFKHNQYTIAPFGCEGCGLCAKICKFNAIEMQDVKAGILKWNEDIPVFSTAQLKMGMGTSGLLVNEVKKKLTQNTKAVGPSEIAIIDGSPGIGCPVISSISGVDAVLIVAEPSISGMSDLVRIIDTAKKLQAPVLVCVNKWDVNPELTQGIEAYCLAEKIEYVGKIPYDKTAITAINEGKAVVEIDCEAGNAIRDVLDLSLNFIQGLTAFEANDFIKILE